MVCHGDHRAALRDADPSGRTRSVSNLLLPYAFGDGRRRLLDPEHRVLLLDVASLVGVPRDTHAAQSSLLVGQDGCGDAVDPGGELAHGDEVAVLLDLAQSRAELAPRAPQTRVLDLPALPGVDGLQAVVGQVREDDLRHGSL